MFIGKIISKEFNSSLVIKKTNFSNLLGQMNTLKMLSQTVNLKQEHSMPATLVAKNISKSV